MKPKVGILTFHYNFNYGAVLQAYATSCVLRRAGFEPVFPQYVPPYFLQLISPFRGWGLRGGGVLKKLPKRLSLLRRRSAFNDFRKKHIPQTHRYRSLGEFKADISSYHALVVGSDQVWNLKWMQEFDPYYFLGFLPNEVSVRRISYAACFGQSEQRPDYFGRIRDHLNKFHHIGVRNELSASLVRRSCGRESTVVVDPTLLHDFSDITAECPVNGEYILIYALDEKAVKLAEQLAMAVRERSGFKIVYIASEHLLSFPAADIYLKDAGPDQWVELFRRAAYVITDSFHGCVFSIKLKRKFLAYTEGWRAGRITSLLESYGLMDKLILSADQIENAVNRLFSSTPSHENVHGAVGAAAERSRGFLLEALGASGE